MKRTILLIFSILFAKISLSQNIIGIITNANTVIVNAYIINKQTNEHWHTNEFGRFEIPALSELDTLIISHIGFEKITLIITDNLFNKDLKIELIPTSLELSEVRIKADIKSINIISKIDIETKPVASSQEILRTVPGLIIGQHAGGGKAEQIFLRGFDIDHGTDINISVDGMPVNMVSHAHGQGYADMHFLIPEIVEKIDYGKGCYYADKGNFATAGYVQFKTKDRITDNIASFEYGSFNTLRTTTVLNLINLEKHNAYIASDFLLSDGAFESPQNFNRINLFGKYVIKTNEYDKISISTSYFTSKWDASGQIPLRAVESGLISRFGTIDDTEGGKTSRTNLNMEYLKYINNKTFVKSKVFYSAYDFELYSNFTFFLEDTINGDQIKQKENRSIFGAKSELNNLYNIGNTKLKLKTAGGFRHDIINNNELSHTKNRKTTLNTIQLGDINETNIYGYFNAEFDFGKWLINPALRLDFFKFDYANTLIQKYKNLSISKTALSPKLNILYNQSNNLQFFLKSGVGFHSNDTRVVVAKSEENILPLAFGSDLGIIIKPAKRLVVDLALWYLFLEQEFVYVGDAGIVESSGETQRLGIDFGIRYQLTKYLFFNNNINYAYARSINEAEDENHIPLAPNLTNTGGLSIINIYGFNGGIHYRYINSRPANEYNSIIANGYFVTDLNLSYSFKKVELAVIIQNIFNTEWNETQFATESRLYNETASVEEIHFTPGAPFFIKFKLSYKF